MFDTTAAKALAKIAGVNMEEYARSMFEAGEDLSGRDGEDILYTDFKEFAIGDHSISVGQGFYMSDKAYDEACGLVKKALPDAVTRSDSDMIFYMLTSIPSQSTLLLCAGKGADELVSEAFGVQVGDHQAELPGIVSRKKQLIPPLREKLLV